MRNKSTVNSRQEKEEKKNEQKLFSVDHQRKLIKYARDRLL